MRPRNNVIHADEGRAIRTMARLSITEGSKAPISRSWATKWHRSFVMASNNHCSIIVVVEVLQTGNQSLLTNPNHP
jgi:hypothetical protein